MNDLEDLTLENLDIEALWPSLTAREREEERWRLAGLCRALYSLEQWHRERSSTIQFDKDSTKREIADT